MTRSWAARWAVWSPAKNGQGNPDALPVWGLRGRHDGNDLHLTIDATIQYYCERVLAEGVSKRIEVQDGGFAIAMDPRPGPSWLRPTCPPYDLNNPRTIQRPGPLRQADAIKNDSSLSDEVPKQSTRSCSDEQ